MGLQLLGWGTGCHPRIATRAAPCPYCRCAFDVLWLLGRGNQSSRTQPASSMPPHFQRGCMRGRASGPVAGQLLWTQRLAGNQGSVFQPEMKGSFHQAPIKCPHTPWRGGLRDSLLSPAFPHSPKGTTHGGVGGKDRELWLRKGLSSFCSFRYPRVL